jgi:hypothetical protein
LTEPLGQFKLEKEVLNEKFFEKQHIAASFALAAS